MIFENLLSKYNEQTATSARTLREFLLKELHGIIEIPDPAANMIAYGYGPGYEDMIGTILLSKKGVKLGLYKGSELPDPDKLLTGSGKVHRYVEIRSAVDIKNPALKKLLGEALNAYKKRMDGDKR